jgi:ethanolamine utilization protein EutN
MQTGRVVGVATASLKHESMTGRKLLLVQPALADGRTPDGDPILAVDGVGAGPGEIVMISSDGRGARDMLQSDTTPVRWTIIGIRD